MMTPTAELIPATPEMAAQLDQYRNELATIIESDLLRSAGDAAPHHIRHAALLAAALEVLNRGAKHMLRFPVRLEDAQVVGKHASCMGELDALLDQLAPGVTSVVAAGILEISRVLGARLLAALPVMGSA